MAGELERQLGALRHGEHLCMIYEEPEEQMAAIAPFLGAGLARGERCVYIMEDRAAEEVARALSAAGVDVPRETQRGALVLLRTREAHLRGGRFDPDRMLAFLRQTLDEALSAGFAGLRVTGEMSWSLGPEPGCDRAIEYEARLNDFLAGSHALAACQYHRRRFPPAVIHDVLRTHPVAIVGRRVCPNLYYEPPDLALGQASAARRVDWMLGQLRRARGAEEALQRSQQALEALIAAAPVGICALDRDARVTLWNPAAERLFGWTKEEVVGHLPPMVPQDKQAEFWAHFESLQRGRVLEEMETRRQRKDGDLVHVSISSAVLRDADEEIYGAMALFGDITRRQRAEDAYRALLEVGRLLVSSVDEDRILALVVEKAMELLHASASGVCLMRGAKEEVVLEFSQSRGLPGTYRHTLRLAAGEGVLGRALQERRPVWTADILNDPSIWLSEGTRQRILDHRPPPAILAAPLLRGDEAVGGLVVYRPAGATYSADEVELLAGLASQAAVAIENARLFQQEQWRREQLDAVRAVTGEITRELDLTALLALIQRRAIDLVGGLFGAIWLWDEASQVLIPRAWQGYGDWVKELRLRLGEGITGTVAQRREGLIVNDYQSWAHAYPVALNRTGVTAALAEPLICRGRLLGVITLNNTGMERPFTEQDREILALFAAQAAIAIENARLFQEETARRRQLEAVRAVTAEITPEMDLSRLLALIHRRAAELVGAPSGAVYLWDEATQSLVPRAWYGVGEWAGEVRIRPGEGVTGVVAQQREGLIVNDYRSWPNAIPLFLEHSQITGALAEPLFYRDRLLGVLTVNNAETARPFTEQDREALALFAAHAAIAIENARLYEESQRRAREAIALAEVVRTVTASLDLTKVFDLIVTAVRRLMEVPFAGILLLDEQRGELGYVTTAALPPGRAGVRLRVGEGVAGAAVAQGVPVQSANLLQDPRHLALGLETEGFRSMLCAPLLIGGRPLGSLNICHRDEHEFSPAEVQLLARFADQAALAMENARLYAEAQREIADRRRAEEDLRQLNVALANAMPGISRLDPAGRYVSVNEAYAHMLGAEPGDVLGTDWKPWVHPDDREAALAAYERMLRDGKAEFEGRGVRQDGSVFHKHVLMVKIPDEGGTFAGHHCFMRDITERRQAEDALRQSEKLAAMGTLLAGVAHELNNPLAVVVGTAALLRDALHEGPHAEAVAMLAQAAGRCSRIVRNFVTLARQEPAERQPVRLSAVVQAVAELMAHALHLDQVELGLNLAPELPALWGDPHQLHQVVVNLVTNAHQAVRESPPPRRVTLTTRADSLRRRIALTVADTGPGIPPALRARIFEPFFTTKPPGQGTGLGLALCRRIAEDHEGTLELEEAGGPGAVFRLELPLGEVPAEAPEGGAAAAPTPVRGKAVLVVDDEPAVAEMLAEILAAEGHRVDTAADGAIALGMLRRGAYDLILCDLRMPELDGPGLYRELERRDPALLRRLIFVTGDVFGAGTREFLEHAGVPVLRKPCTPEEVRAMTQQVLRAP